jgi:hypothetical protein
LGGWNIYPGIDMPGYRDINPNGFFIRPKPVVLKRYAGSFLLFNPVGYV